MAEQTAYIKVAAIQGSVYVYGMGAGTTDNAMLSSRKEINSTGITESIGELKA